MSDNPLYIGQEKKFNKGKLCVSKYLWIFLIIIPVAITLFVRIRFSSIPIQGLNRVIPFDNTTDPNYFSLMTDVHVWYDNRDRHFEEGINYARELQAKYVVIAGDLVNNWKAGSKHQVASRNPIEHEMYHNITTNMSKYFTYIVDISGNHDMWDVGSFNSPTNDFPQYSHYYSQIKNLTEDEFACSTVFIDDNAFILLNPMRFPQPRSVYDFYTHMNRKFLDLFEENIKKASNSTHIYVLLHYPVCFVIEDQKSSSGKSFIQILSESRTTFLITGHTHPAKSSPIHHKNATEIIASDITTHANVGIITEDNGNAVFHTLKTGTKVKALLVNPPPYSQIGGQSYFNDESINVKLLVFTNSSNEDIKVDGIQMKFDHFVKNINDRAVYVANVGKKSGKFTLHFTGYYEADIDCFNGETVPSRWEDPGIVHTMFILGYIWLGIMASIIVFILFPVDLANYVKVFGRFRIKINQWLQSDAWCSFESFIFIIFGFLTLRTRFLRNPLWLRICLFAVLFTLCFVPFGFTRFDGKPGFVSMLGYFASGKLMVEPSGMMLFDCYSLTIIMSCIFMSAMVVDYTTFSWTTLFDAAVIIVLLVANSMIINVFITQLLGVAHAWGNITFVIAPAILFILILVNRILMSRNTRYNDDLLNNSQITANNVPPV